MSPVFTDPRFTWKFSSGRIYHAEKHSHFLLCMRAHTNTHTRKTVWYLLQVTQTPYSYPLEMMDMYKWLAPSLPVGLKVTRSLWGHDRCRTVTSATVTWTDISHSHRVGVTSIGPVVINKIIKHSLIPRVWREPVFHIYGNGFMRKFHVSEAARLYEWREETHIETQEVFRLHNNNRYFFLQPDGVTSVCSRATTLIIEFSPNDSVNLLAEPKSQTYSVQLKPQTCWYTDHHGYLLPLPNLTRRHLIYTIICCKRGHKKAFSSPNKLEPHHIFDSRRLGFLLTVSLFPLIQSDIQHNKGEWRMKKQDTFM